jgi:hypothetical protein
MRTKLWTQNLKGRDYQEALCENERIMLKYKYRTRMEGCGQDSFIPQSRDQCWALVKKAMNIRVLD